MAQLKILSFSTYNDADFLRESQTILRSVKNNPKYPNPMPSIAEVEAIVTSYADDLAACKTGDWEKAAIKNKTRETAESMLNRLGLYVLLIAGDNAEMVMEAGYKLAKTNKRTKKVLGQTVTFTVEVGKRPGEATVVADTVENGLNYTFYCEPAPVQGTSFLHEQRTVTNHTFVGLESGKNHSFWVKVNGRNDQFVVSEVITKMVL